MYCVLAAVDFRKARGCTEKPCEWAHPSLQAEFPYAEIRAINFSHNNDDHGQGQALVTPPAPDITPSEEEMSYFFEMLHVTEKQESKPKKSVILSIIPGHSDR